MKHLLRLKAKSIRNTLDSTESSALIEKEILQWDLFNSSTNVMIYCPVKNEISLMGLLKFDSKNFYFPKIVNDDICAVKYTSVSDFENGKYNIKEPCSNIICGPDSLDMIFIPALAADRWGYRLGYGKGYYDRFLKEIPPKTKRVIPIYSSLLWDDLPIEMHDEKADYVLTEKGITETKIRLANL